MEHLWIQIIVALPYISKGGIYLCASLFPTSESLWADLCDFRKGLEFHSKENNWMVPTILCEHPQQASAKSL